MSIEFQAGAWALLAVVALIIEITHRTFYLLIASIACALAMVVVLVFHAGMFVQIGVVVVACLIGIPAVSRFRRRNTSVHFADRGQTVKVVAVREGRLRVLYRGAEWDAVFAGPEPVPGQTLTIVDMEGSALRVTSP